MTQRPQHLMAEARRGRRVFVVEEPLLDGGAPHLRVRMIDGVTVLTPILADDVAVAERDAVIAAMLGSYATAEAIVRPWLWFWTPAMIGWARALQPRAVIYDCMDELAAFRGASPALLEQEAALLTRADIVFTGGRMLFEAKRARHRNVHPFPSSVDVAHFRTARQRGADPADQAAIPRPRIGWFGVIDERFDSRLVEAVAKARPDWQFVLVGPLAKITEDDLPQGPNVHAIGPRSYAELPSYLAGWDVAIMPFAHNDATRYISPTKTPEYLAGGRPVVSTSIRDVVDPYGRAGLVRIADDPNAFAAAIEAALDDDLDELARRADAMLAGQSWASTWSAMERLIEDVAAEPVPAIARTPSRQRTPATTLTASAAGGTASNTVVAG